MIDEQYDMTGGAHMAARLLGKLEAALLQGLPMSERASAARLVRRAADMVARYALMMNEVVSAELKNVTPIAITRGDDGEPKFWVPDDAARSWRNAAKMLQHAAKAYKEECEKLRARVEELEAEVRRARLEKRRAEADDEDARRL